LQIIEIEKKNEKIMIDVEKISDYYKKVKNANSETAKKELLFGLLHRLFGKDKEADAIIQQMNIGAEKSVFNIPNKNKSGYGRADTQYNSVIIEFEKTIKNKTVLEHAVFQLKEYFVGNWNSGNQNSFTLIATDCINWYIYAPNYSLLIKDKQNSFNLDDVELTEKDKFRLDESNLLDFYYFIDRYLFKTELQKATLNNIEEDFGNNSIIFFKSIKSIIEHLQSQKENPTINLAINQWRSKLKIAYGSFQSDMKIFAIHTYLSVLSKLIAIKSISGNSILLKSMQDVLNGETFKAMQIHNFIEKDFYYWIAENEHYNKLNHIVYDILIKIEEYEFSDVNEDILKGVYQDLIDIETKHKLGEYYTPDWLCELILDSLEIKPDSKILDPACGSGSFLRAYISKVKSQYPDLSPQEIVSNIYGIDIHPLSVLIAKTTIILSLGTILSSLREPLSLRVFLANTLYLPEDDEKVSIFDKTVTITINDKKVSIPKVILYDTELFDKIIEILSNLANKEKKFTEREVYAILDANISFKCDESSYYYLNELYKALYDGVVTKRDTIWEFIIKNLMKPMFLKNSFDFIIGNPPWLTYADFNDIQYQKLIENMSKEYYIIPNSKADMPHLELASIFLLHSINYFLKQNGELAFVLPRSFMSASQHDKIRSAQAKELIITEVWDLDKVNNLFKIPSCVLFCKKGSIQNYDSGIIGLEISGKIEKHNDYFANVKNKLQYQNTTYYYSVLRDDGNVVRSALAKTKIEKSKINMYAKRFYQGATIVPRCFYFIEYDEKQFSDLNDRLIYIKTNEEVLKSSKQPWKMKISGSVHSDFIFYTALSKNIFPFHLESYHTITLPIIVHQKIKGNYFDDNKILLRDNEILLSEGHFETSQYYDKVNELWNKNKTEKSKDVSFHDYINWQNKLTQQDLNKRYVVLYTASATDASACMIDRNDYDKHFIIESKAYYYETDNIKESLFLTAFLNSTIPNKIIKDFQSRGLFGARDIHKKILDVPFPAFNDNNALHIELTILTQNAILKVEKYFEQNEFNVNEFTPHQLGTIRSQIRKLLKEEYEVIDNLINEIILEYSSKD
jgi:type I restriction-modification system DNA methylase subunit